LIKEPKESWTTPARYSELLAELDIINIDAAAEFFDLNQSSTGRYMNGRNPIPKVVAMLLELMVAHGETPERVEALLERACAYDDR
jgi:hypothetical protein